MSDWKPVIYPLYETSLPPDDIFLGRGAEGQLAICAITEYSDGACFEWIQIVYLTGEEEYERFKDIPFKVIDWKPI